MQSNISINLEQGRVAPSTETFRIGRTMGILLLLQLVAALTLPFILTKSLSVGSPDFLNAVAENAFQVRGAVLLSFFGSALTIGLGLTAYHIFRQHNNTVALLFLMVCGISCILDLMHASSIMSVLYFSERITTTSELASESHDVATAVYGARRSAHIIQLVGIASWMFVFYSALFWFKLIPHAFAFVGIIAVASQFVGVTLMMLLGKSVIGEMAMPLLPIEIAVGAWLIIKGIKTHSK